ncbi:MAG TPA: DNA-directed RNA polymerase subunit alpha C-terminal domain-containing protein [Phycisphaerae bacterium]|nr:DNA-directed RNA polymerase subunit alpha C-terminal domain-containing protein [Phycisphaerae bacterium]
MMTAAVADKASSEVKSLYERALEAADSGAFDQALEDLEKAHELDPNDSDVIFKLAYFLDLRGDDERAVELYEALAHSPKTHENVLLNLSVLYEDAGRYDEAEELLHRLLSAKPNHPVGRMYYRHVDSSLDMQLEDDSEKRVITRNLLLETPITDFELSVRARNCLKKMNIRSLGDLLKTTEAELLSYKNFGETSLHEIREMLGRKGLRLGQTADEAHQAQRKELLKNVSSSVPETVLNKPVADLELSVRSGKALQRLGIATIGDLASRTEAELLGVKNFGQTSLDEIKERLVNFGLSLRKMD